MTSVCLVVEGTYPFVTGGVCTWASALVASLPELRWSVGHLSELPLPDREPQVGPEVEEVVHLAVPPGGGPVPSRPQVAALAERLPAADVYHATTVGAASAVAAAAATNHRAAFVLTEHGIASEEVAIAGGPTETGSTAPSSADGRRAWVAALRDEAAHAYGCADVVTSVSETGARHQRRLGAATVQVIPHPPPDPTGPVRRSDPCVPLVGLVARVVPLKDVAGFVLACAGVAAVHPTCRFVVLGPLDADEGYAAECQQLAEAVGLGDRLRFTGETDVGPWWPELSVLVSTSRSEARPFAVLEAMQHGVPVVATAVGDCAHMLLGGHLPPAGVVVPPADVVSVVDAVCSLLRAPRRSEALGTAGRARIAAGGGAAAHAARYRALYRDALAWARHDPCSGPGS